MSTEQNQSLSHAIQTMGKKLMGFIRARVSNQADAEDVPPTTIRPRRDDN
jgi:DNA-directed RNA polymerase specialized sigma24 family protein